jgi:hypothetical protein
MRKIVGLLLLLLPLGMWAQKPSKKDKSLIENLKGHIQYLASDALEGRRAGDKGEQKAIDYIIDQYKGISIEPMGEEGFIQNFTIDEGKKLAKHSFLNINDQKAIIDTDFIALSNSGKGTFSSTASIHLNEQKQVWFVDINEVLEANKQNPHFDVNEWLVQNTLQLKIKGATALLLHNSGTHIDNIQFNKNDTAKDLALPVVYFTKQGFRKFFNDEYGTFNIQGTIEFEHITRTAHNLVAFINNHANQTIILGAHLDHLGYNQDKFGLDVNNFIHNGADDNASGTAALIELTKSLCKKAPKNNNYLIIHFSGEEQGLLGSKYWLTHPTYKGNFNYMINMDMVGRYDTVRKLTIGGFGTSSKWAEILAKTPTGLQTHYDSAGTGPSDHASFYRQGIPVLFMFTGSHADYHKATDDWEKINYDGEKEVVRYVQAIIKNADNYGKLDFLKTREQQMGRSTKFTVSLGVLPDYAFTGTGVRIEGVSQGKIAEKLGLQAADVLLKLGDYKLIDVMSYMETLAKFKKGDKTTLLIQRGINEIKFDVQF